MLSPHGFVEEHAHPQKTMGLVKYLHLTLPNIWYFIAYSKTPNNV